MTISDLWRTKAREATEASSLKMISELSSFKELLLRKKHTGSNFIRLNAANARIVGIIFFFFSFKSCATLAECLD